MVAFSIGLQDDGSEKDTLRNIRQNGEMVIHIASCNQLPDLNLSSATLPPEVSEVEAGALALSSVEGYSLPRLSDSKVAFMASTHQIIELGNNHQALILAEVSSIFVDDECVTTLENGRRKILADKIEPLGRLGASEYVSFGEILSMKRPA